MKINLNDFKKVSDTKDSAILENKDGHKVTIVKKILSPKLKEHLDSLPIHLKSGDLVALNEERDRANDPNFKTDFPENNVPVMGLEAEAYDPNAASLRLLQNPGIGDSAKEAIANRLGINAPAETLNQAIPQAESSHEPSSLLAAQADQQSQVPSIQKAGGMDQSQLSQSPLAQQQQPQDLYSQGAQEQEQGIKGEAAAQGMQGQQQAKVYQNQIDQEQKALENYQTLYQSHDDEIKATMDDIRNNLVDPKRFWNNKSTPGKISTVIGLILGGMGAGLTKGPNMALELLNKQIDQDVEGQRANLGARENLLSANHQRMQDLYQSTQMTHAINLEMAKNEVAKIAAQNQNPLLQARAQQLLGQLHQQQGQYLHNLTMGQMLTSGALPASAAGYLPKDLMERSVKLPNGMLASAASKEDAETARKSFDQYDTILNQLGEMKNFQQEHGVTFPLTDANVQGGAMRDELINSIRELRGLKRISPELMNQLEKVVPDPGALRQGKASVQIDHLINFINMKKAQDANAFIMGPNKAPTQQLAAPNMSPPNLRARVAER